MSHLVVVCICSEAGCHTNRASCPNEELGKSRILVPVGSRADINDVPVGQLPDHLALQGRLRSHFDWLRRRNHPLCSAGCEHSSKKCLEWTISGGMLLYFASTVGKRQCILKHHVHTRRESASAMLKEKGGVESMQPFEGSKVCNPSRGRKHATLRLNASTLRLNACLTFSSTVIVVPDASTMEDIFIGDGHGEPDREEQLDP